MPQHDNQTYQQLKRAILQRRFFHLNPMQRQAVLAVEGPVLILAGAGSGKTTVLIHRIACLLQFGLASVRQDDMPPLSEEDWRILELAAADGSYMERAGQLIAHDVPAPWNILAITFTNKAAGELRARLAGMLGTRGEDVHAATFHAACSRILRAEIEALGYNRNFTIYDTDDSVRVIKDAMAELHISDKNFAPKALLGNISRAKDKMLTPEGLRQSAGDNFALQVTARIYGRYQQMLKDANALDFDDIILLTVKLFQQFPEVLQKYQRRYRYIMVDEYQDTNHAQYLLVSLLAAAHGNLCVVGDDDQSIYKFRGATIENILSFEQQFGQTKVIRLEQNYRSTGTILDAANAVISRNSQRKGKTLWTQNSRGEKVLYHKAADEQREAHFIASTIRKNHEKGAKYSDHAILYRMNALSSTLEQMFIRQGIPYRIIGGLKFFDRKEVKDILAYLAVLNNPDDSLRLRRIINEPKRGIGEATMNTAQQVAESLGQSLYRTLQTAEEYAPLSGKSRALMEFTAMMDGIAESVDEVPLIETLEQVLDQSGYVRALEAKNDMESRGRLENIGELKTTILKYMEETEEPSLSGFLEEIALYTDLDNLSEDDDKVVLMTLHSAKGLEFPYVFITGMEEGIFPGQQAIYEPTELEEERRLAYVGITRAKKELYISNSVTRMLYGRTQRNEPSRFLREIEPEYIEETRSPALERRSQLGGWGSAYSDTVPGGASGYSGASGWGRSRSGFGSGSSSGSRSGYLNAEYNGGSRGFGADYAGRGTSGSASADSRSRSGGFGSGYGRAAAPKAPAKPVQFTGAPVLQPTKGLSPKEYKVGDTVFHRAFGKGRVLEVDSRHGDTMVVVGFESNGTKKMMANAPMLEKVSEE